MGESSSGKTVRMCPSPAIWCELCRGFDVFALCRETEPLSTVRETQHCFLARHPEFETNEELQTLDKELSETNA